jgi:telomere length regulation protein
MLPPALHERYSTLEEQPHPEFRQVEGITRKALERSKEDAEDALGSHPEIIRERRLRLGSAARNGRGGIQVLDGNSKSLRPAAKSTTPEFTSIAAEYFIIPLINHMWLYLRDSTTRLRDGAGTGILLDAMVQTQLLGTITVLVHAARHAPDFLAVIAPAAMELAITLGSKPLDRNVKAAQNNAVLRRIGSRAHRARWVCGY